MQNYHYKIQKCGSKGILIPLWTPGISRSGQDWVDTLPEPIMKSASQQSLPCLRGARHHPTVPPLSKLSGTDTYKKSWPCKNYDSLSNPILLHVELHSNAYIQCKCQHTWIKVSQSIAYIPFTTWKALHLKAWHIPSRLPSPHNSTIYHIQNPTNKLTTITVLINMQHVKSVYDWNHRLGDQS